MSSRFYNQIQDRPGMRITVTLDQISEKLSNLNHKLCSSKTEILQLPKQWQSSLYTSLILLFKSEVSPIWSFPS